MSALLRLSVVAAMVTGLTPVYGTHHIKVRRVIQSGVGCPAVGHQVQVSDVKPGNLLEVSFPQSHEVRTASGIQSSYCNLQIELEIPYGLKTAIAETSFAGTMELDAHTWARPDTTMWFTGNLAGQVSFLGHTHQGPFSGDYVTRSVAQGHHLNWSPCGGSRIARLNVKSRLTARSLTEGALAFAKTENAELRYSERYHLVVGRCH